MKSRIDTYNKNNPIAEITVDDYPYRFSLCSVDKDSHDWIIDVISYQMQKIHNRAVTKTTASIQSKLQKLIGVEK